LANWSSDNLDFLYLFKHLTSMLFMLFSLCFVPDRHCLKPFAYKFSYKKLDFCGMYGYYISTI
jgi:hypothetical protein